MKRFAIVFALAITLGGCANLAPLFNFATTGISNPVTPDMVYRTEQTMIIAVSGLNAYKRACIAKTIAQSCRDVVVKLQSYTRPAAVAIKDLRAAVRANDQVTAVAAYNVVIKLIDDFKSTAVAAGVQ
jgi:hypothetical protein